VGIKVRELSDSEKANLKLKAGVSIADVLEGSAAEEAGLQAGDVVEEIGGQDVGSVSQFNSLISSAKKGGKKHAVLLVRRGDESRYVPVSISD
jgi:S1-C subfamily serine protease